MAQNAELKEAISKQTGVLPEPNLIVEQPGAHFDHLLRQTRIHHQQLSVMADSKAQMLITISSLVLTLSAPLLLEQSLRIAALVLMISALLTVLLASYAIMPKHISENLQPHRPGDNPSNILFFGHFVHMPYELYEAAWHQILNSPSLSYQVQIQEIYGLGKYLAAYKFRYLRFAYIVFLVGLFAAACLAIMTTVAA